MLPTTPDRKPRLAACLEKLLPGEETIYTTGALDLLREPLRKSLQDAITDDLLQRALLNPENPSPALVCEEEELRALLILELLCELLAGSGPGEVLRAHRPALLQALLQALPLAERAQIRLGKEAGWASFAVAWALVQPDAGTPTDLLQAAWPTLRAGLATGRIGTPEDGDQPWRDPKEYVRLFGRVLNAWCKGRHSEDPRYRGQVAALTAGMTCAPRALEPLLDRLAPEQRRVVARLCDLATGLFPEAERPDSFYGSANGGVWRACADLRTLVGNCAKAQIARQIERLEGGDATVFDAVLLADLPAGLRGRIRALSQKLRETEAAVRKIEVKVPSPVAALRRREMESDRRRLEDLDALEYELHLTEEALHQEALDALQEALERAA